MKSVNDWIRTHLESTLEVARRCTIEEIRNHVATRLDPHFDELRNDRIAMGFIRYESVVGRSPDYLGYISQALAKYVITRNREYLVDLAFYVAAEWVTPSMSDTYFESTDHPE